MKMGKGKDEDGTKRQYDEGDTAGDNGRGL